MQENKGVKSKPDATEEEKQSAIKPSNTETGGEKDNTTGEGKRKVHSSKGPQGMKTALGDNIG